MCSQFRSPSQRMCAFSQLHTGLWCTVQLCVCYLMRVCTRFLPCVMTERVHVAGLPLLSTSEGILCSRTLSSQALHGACQGWGSGWWMGITHWWPLSASKQSHTHSSHLASRKTTGTAGKHIYHNLYYAHVSLLLMECLVSCWHLECE